MTSNTFDGSAALKKKTKLWIDLSDLYYWRGNYTGIQRVNFELAKSFANNNSVEAQFFFYNVFFNRFQKTSIEEVIEQNKHKDAESKPSLINRLKLANMRVVLRVILPFKVRRALKNTKKTLFNSALVKGPFASGDTVMILSDIWGLPGANEGIATLRKSKRLKVGHLIHDLIPLVTPQFVLDTHAQSFKEHICLLYTSPSPRDQRGSRMPSSA